MAESSPRQGSTRARSRPPSATRSPRGSGCRRARGTSARSRARRAPSTASRGRAAALSRPARERLRALPRARGLRAVPRWWRAPARVHRREVPQHRPRAPHVRPAAAQLTARRRRRRPQASQQASGGRRARSRRPRCATWRSRAPYMHDGSFATLAQVVRYYAVECGTSKTTRLDPKIQPFDAGRSRRGGQRRHGPRRVPDALTGETRAGLATALERARRLRLRLVDAKGAPSAAGRGLAPAGDVLPGARRIPPRST